MSDPKGRTSSPPFAGVPEVPEEPEPRKAREFAAQSFVLPEGLPEIYYDAGQHEFLRQAEDRSWIRFNEVGIRRELKLAGIRTRPGEGETCSEMERVISKLIRSRNVTYAGSVAGHYAGIVEEGGRRILVTDSPRMIEPRAGKSPLIDSILKGLFPTEKGIGSIQRATFCSWLKVSVGALRKGSRHPGQALAIAGPPNSGKTLLQTIITWILGGRCARPYRYMSGFTGFNAELFAAEHLIIDDEAASRDGRIRAAFAASLKQFTVADGARCEGKYCSAIDLRPFWRVSITLNDEPEALGVLPSITEDLADKIILLRAHRAKMPMQTQTVEQRQAFTDSLKAELPAFLHKILSSPIPAALISQRFGVREFHHPEILEILSEASPCRRLLTLIDTEFFRMPKGKHWQGTAVELERLLIHSPRVGAQARRLLSWDGAAGTYLGQLRKSHASRIERKRTSSERIWIIKPMTP